MIDLQYFIDMQNSNSDDTPDHSAKKWDKRADNWEKVRIETKNEKGDERIQNTVEYLRNRGLLNKNFDIADIGCGPGNFSVEFAKEVNSVVGFDISQRMVHYGMENAKRQNVDNVYFKVCDFQNFDIKKEGFEKKFDLVFTSMTPAIHGIDGLEKSMNMSRKYCCNITHIFNKNELKTRMMKEIFNREVPSRFNGKWFYSLFNFLYLSGFYPETSYYNRKQECKIVLDKGYVEVFMEQMLKEDERTKENEDKIWDWINKNTDDEKVITEISETCYARTIWDVTRKTDRPDYNLMK